MKQLLLIKALLLIFILICTFTCKAQLPMGKTQLLPSTWVNKTDSCIIVTTFDTLVVQVLKATWNAKEIPTANKVISGYRFWFPLKSEARLITNLHN